MSQANPTDFQANTYAENYVLYGDESKAWRVVFPTSKCKPKSVHAKASLFHKQIKVQLRIHELRTTLKKQSEEEFSITTLTLKKMLLDTAIMGSKGRYDQQGNIIPINLGATISAISEINRMDGNHAPVKQETFTSDMTPWSSIKASVDKLKD